MSCEPYPIVSDNPQVQADYIACRENGHGHKMAEMLALGEPPVVKTDATFWRGNWNQFDGGPLTEAVANKYAAEAKKHGVDPKGKRYIAGLAAYPGDPKAWVDGRGDIERVVRERNWSCEGDVNVSRIESVDEPPPGMCGRPKEDA